MLFLPNRIDFNYYIFHFIFTHTRTTPYTTCILHSLTGGILVFVCVYVFMFMRVWTLYILDLDRYTHTTRLLIYRCLYMFALAAAVAVVVVATFCIICGTRLLYVPFCHALPCHTMPFSTHQIHHLTNPIHTKLFFGFCKELLTLFRLWLVCYFFRHQYDAVSFYFSKYTIMINRTLRKINQYGNV